MKTTSLLCFIFIYSLVAQAYVPPSFFIAHSLSKKHADIVSGQFKHRISFYRSNGEESKSVTENLILSSNGEFQSTIYDGSNVIFEQKGKPSSPAYNLLFNRDSSGIFDHLKSLELPMKTEKELYAKADATIEGTAQPITDPSETELQQLTKKTPTAYLPEPKIGMVRYENRVAVVLGLGNPSQLWLEKDSLIPLKLLLPAAIAKMGDDIEYRFSGFMLYRSVLYPRTMQIFKAGKLWVKSETSEVNIGSISPVKSTEADSPGGDLKRNLEDFYKLAR